MKTQIHNFNTVQTGRTQILPSGKAGAGFDPLLKTTLSQIPHSGDTAKAPGLAEPDSGPGLIDIGTITTKNPTISQLLYKSPLKGKCWHIVHNKINDNKAFRTIRPGTRIMMDPATNELLWGKDLENILANGRRNHEKKERGQPSSPGLPEMHLETCGASLSRAVRDFIGRDYDTMNCYELVVGGLKAMGVQYQGSKGLGRHLIDKALADGLPENHYLNGEGLVSASGRPVFKKTLLTVTDPAVQARDLVNTMKPVLEDGQVLSFSMRDRGHTGVVSRTGNAWTFINAGEMDHNILGNNGSKKVGEEDLASEIENWCRRAFESGQGLKITLGTLTRDRLSMFSRPLSRKV